MQRPEAQQLIALTEITLADGTGDGLLDGAVDVEVDLADGRTVTGSLDLPPGSPGRPPTADELTAKVADCLALGGVEGTSPEDLGWATGATLLATHLGGGARPAGAPHTPDGTATEGRP